MATKSARNVHIYSIQQLWSWNPIFYNRTRRPPIVGRNLPLSLELCFVFNERLDVRVWFSFEAVFLWNESEEYEFHVMHRIPE